MPSDRKRAQLGYILVARDGVVKQQTAHDQWNDQPTAANPRESAHNFQGVYLRYIFHCSTMARSGTGQGGGGYTQTLVGGEMDERLRLCCRNAEQYCALELGFTHYDMRLTHPSLVTYKTSGRRGHPLATHRVSALEALLHLCWVCVRILPSMKFS